MGWFEVNTFCRHLSIEAVKLIEKINFSLLIHIRFYFNKVFWY
jgi:hypothetical protein